MRLLLPLPCSNGDDNGTFTAHYVPNSSGSWTTFAEGEADWHQHAQDAIEEAIAA